MEYTIKKCQHGFLVSKAGERGEYVYEHYAFTTLREAQEYFTILFYEPTQSVDKE